MASFNFGGPETGWKTDQLLKITYGKDVTVDTLAGECVFWSDSEYPKAACFG